MTIRTQWNLNDIISKQTHLLPQYCTRNSKYTFFRHDSTNSNQDNGSVAILVCTPYQVSFLKCCPKIPLSV